MKTVQLYGGGIDSVCIAHLMKPDVLVYFALGTPECAMEARVAERAGAIIDERFYLADQVLPNKILPLRNLILIAGAAYYGNRILLGSTAGDTTKDKDAEFLRRTEAVLRHVLTGDAEKSLPWFEDGVRIIAPAIKYTKTQLITQYIAAGGSRAALLDSRSCYSSEETECGICRSCVRKYVALKLNGIEAQFAQRPNLEEALAYAQRRGRGREAVEIEECMKL